MQHPLIILPCLWVGNLGMADLGTSAPSLSQGCHPGLSWGCCYLEAQLGRDLLPHSLGG